MALQNTKTYAVFEPAFPYVYMPELDYLKWQGMVSTFYRDKQIHCNFLPRHTCYFDHSCNHVKNFFEMMPQIFKFGDSTSTSIKYTISMDLSKLMIPGHHLGGTSNQCYFGIFSSKEIEQDTWYLGNIIMEDHYIVYDATPAEQGESYVQMGIARSVDKLLWESGAE